MADYRGIIAGVTGTAVSYQITWLPEILRRFTDEWSNLGKVRQREVMDALEGIDHQLISSPMLTGESRDTDSHRVLIHPPVTVVFRVDLRLQIVQVVQAQIMGKRET